MNTIVDNMIICRGWMIEWLGLRGNKLLIFAIIWGFTGNTKSRLHLRVWTINYPYIEKWTGLGKAMVDTILEELADNTCIEWDREKEEVRVTDCYMRD